MSGSGFRVVRTVVSAFNRRPLVIGSSAPAPRSLLSPSFRSGRQVLSPDLIGTWRSISLSSRWLSAEVPDPEKNEKKVGIVKKFKQMWKDYWYVLIPVHVATSVVWYGGFYVMCKSGIDVAALLAYFGTSETYLEKVRNSDLGYFALAYACYKVATPARYTVTVGGTTFTIRYLRDLGYLRTSGDLGNQFKDKKAELHDQFRESKDKYREEWTSAWEKYAKSRQKKP